MSYLQEYERWKRASHIDAELKQQLISIEGNEKEIEDRFYKSLEFGTGGLRGVIGAGTNRMNTYTVRKATQGLAQYIAKQGEEAKRKGVAIAYDSRHKSPEFAEEAGRVLAQNGIKAYVFEELRPTPELSFAVRHLGTTAGIVITASHNPPEYNGYKVYWSDGAQIATDLADAITHEISQVADELQVEAMDLEEAQAQGLFEWLGKETDDAYQAQLRTLALQPSENNKDFKVVFTPLHGTGNLPVRQILADMGFEHVYVVPEQELPDPNFSTVKSPNPEEHEAFKLAIALAEEVGADMIMGTDPDTDRAGVVVRDNNGEFTVLTGNQLGALLLDYLLSQRSAQGTLPENGVVIKTIVTSEIGAVVAKQYGLDTLDTLTGFKYIGEKIKQFEETKEKTFLFGYEESYGYLAGAFCRDKDAVQACMLAAEMGAYYQKQGLTLYQALLQLFAKVGYFKEDLVSLTLKGLEGVAKINEMMDQLRKQPPSQIGPIAVKEVKDYQAGIDGLPKANVLKFFLEDDSWFAARPSGTEPKIKFYFGVKGNSVENAIGRLNALKQEVMQLIKS
ncbi:phospho-sugar mutase [Ammoniphilus sp. CFH 90114]|uniref:phospho-sugar mutase n=1 Tax=Ammoniphilus sp. CFH 90114 TaxID=2493665 RepID=UPI00100E2781|nr:phospho-sugar mutase [Ammoniphilus sp. CFH 90114]RXT04378.1 phospho-sugar mutase [Ammoniphilus sp. CFH 90114]